MFKNIIARTAIVLVFLALTPIALLLWNNLYINAENANPYLQRVTPLRHHRKHGWIGGNLQTIFSWGFFLPEGQIRKGLVYTGSNYRLRRVIKELLDGKENANDPIKIAVIGGSISWCVLGALVLASADLACMAPK